MAEAVAIADVMEGKSVFVASAEGGLDTETDFEPVADPYEQVLACYHTLTTLTRTKDGFLREHDGIRGWRDTLGRLLSFRGRLEKDPETAAFAVNATVFFLDASMTDLMSRMSAEAPEGSRSEYYREEKILSYLSSVPWAKNILTKVPITRHEAEEFYRQMQPDDLVHSLDDIRTVVKRSEENPSLAPCVYFSRCVSPKELREIHEYIQSTFKGKNNVTVTMPVRMGDQVVLFQDKRAGAETVDTYSYKPLSYVPVQDVWREMLVHGKTLYQDDRPQWQYFERKDGDTYAEAKNAVAAIVHDSPETFTGSGRNIRKYRAALESDRSIVSTEGLHEVFVASAYAKPHPVLGEPVTVITRSGVSANELAMLAAVDEIAASERDDIPVGVHIFDGWYYENLTTRVSKDPRVAFAAEESDARIFCIDHNPTNSYAPGSEAYKQDKQALLLRIAEKAKADPDHRFAIVYDKTAEITLSLSDIVDDWPSNLSVYETMSLTKHQHGDRNGFFGAVVHFGFSSHEDLIRQRTRALGEPTPYTIASFPHVHGSDVNRLIAHDKELAHEMASLFEQENKTNGTDWRIESYNYFAYILPPARIIMDNLLMARMMNLGYIAVGGEQKDFDELTQHDREILLDDPEFRQGFIKHLQSFVDMYVYGLTHAEDPFVPGIVQGDSFGLDDTRIASISNTYATVLGREMDLITVPRISFGRNTDIGDIRRFTQELLRQFSEGEELSRQLYKKYKETVMHVGHHIPMNLQAMKSTHRIIS